MLNPFLDDVQILLQCNLECIGENIDNQMKDVTVKIKNENLFLE